MILIHEKANRGHSRRGWLDSHHTFSFAGFTDPTRMGFENLRVLNEDRIIPGAGCAPHRHENMDMLTLVLSGALRHEDHRGGMPSDAQARLPEGPGEVLGAGGQGRGALLPQRSASLIGLAHGRADKTLNVDTNTSLRWITEGAALVFGMPARRRLR